MIPMLSFNISICSTICEDVSNSSTSPSSHALISASLSARSLVFWWQLQYSFRSRTTLIPFCTSIVLPFQVLYCVSHLAFFSFFFSRCCNICCVFWKTNHYRTVGDICKLLLHSLQSLVTLISICTQLYLCLWPQKTI